MTVSFTGDDPKAPFAKNGDRVVAFAGSVKSPWSSAVGWAKAETEPVALRDSSNRATFDLYNKGRVNVYLSRWLGINEFGKDLGYARNLIALGTVNVKSATCKDEAVANNFWIQTRRGSKGEYTREQINVCRQYRELCGDPKATVSTGNGAFPLQSLCSKTCNVCQNGNDYTARVKEVADHRSSSSSSSNSANKWDCVVGDNPQFKDPEYDKPCIHWAKAGGCAEYGGEITIKNCPIACGMCVETDVATAAENKKEWRCEEKGATPHGLVALGATHHPCHGPACARLRAHASPSRVLA